MGKFLKTKPHKDLSLTAKYKYYLGISIAILSACAPESVQKTADTPDWVIPEDKMIVILTDVHLIEGARIGKKVLGDSLYAIDHYTKLWDKHNIRESQYDSSFRFYSRNAEKMDLLYEEVITNLSTMSSLAEGENPEAKEELEREKTERADSIAKAKAQVDSTDLSDSLTSPSDKN